MTGMEQAAGIEVGELDPLASPTHTLVVEDDPDVRLMIGFVFMPPGLRDRG